MSLSAVYIHSNPSQRFGIYLVFITVFIAGFKKFTANSGYKIATTATFLYVYLVGNSLSTLVKQSSQHFVNSTLIFGGLLYDNG